MDDSRRERELKKVVFHGCNAAAGTQMTLDRPSLQKPFFVSTHPDIALFTFCVLDFDYATEDEPGFRFYGLETGEDDPVARYSCHCAGDDPEAHVEI